MASPAPAGSHSISQTEENIRSEICGPAARVRGAVDKIFLWDPLIAGQAQDKLALMLIKGEKIAAGLDLGLPGYRNLKSIPGTPHGLAGSGWIAIDKSNAGKYPF